MLTLILATVCLFAAAPAVSEPTTDVLMDLRWQKPAIEVKLNGTGPYWFLLDSGAGPYVIVDSDLAAELRVPPEGKDKVGDPSNPHALSVDRVYLDRVEVGSLVGKRLMARLDTGSTGFLSLPPDLAKQLPLAGEPIKVGRAHTVNRQYSILSADLRGEVHLGGLRIENPTLHFMDSIGANVGTDPLRALVVTIDRKNQRARLVSDGRPIAP